MGRIKEYYMELAESKGLDFADVIQNELSESLENSAQSAFRMGVDLDKWKDFLPMISQFEVDSNVGEVLLIGDKFYVVSAL